jgi:hypothetical protein
MAGFDGVADRIAAAVNLPEVLGEACEAFEAMLIVIRQNDRPDGHFFVPMVMAGASAGNGRDHVLFAPSLPLRRPHAGAAGVDSQPPMSAREAADWLAGVCQVLAARLAEKAASAELPRDREACLGAAECAREVLALFVGSGPP